MSIPAVFLVSLVASASCLDLPDSLPPTDPWFVPSFINGTFVWITKAFVKAELALLANDPNLVEYYLYTPKNPMKHQQLDQDDPESIKNSNFNASNPTRFIIHGYMSSAETPVCYLVRDAQLKFGPRNVICLDWSKIAGRSYPTARFVMPSVAKELAKFIKMLLNYTSITIEDIHIVGHSLGAHLAGLAAKELKSQNLTIPFIVACDPALPLFDYNDCSSRLCKTDAYFVESIQTNGGKLGFLRPIGAGAYYPNGGLRQPGCGFDTLGSCSHSRSYMYLAEAIEKNDFPTMECKDGYRSAVLKQCGDTYSSVRMGSPASVGVDGVFYVPVNAKPDYGKG